MTKLDPFREKRKRELLPLFLELSKRHCQHEQVMWFGTLVSEFDLFELEILKDAGYLSHRDTAFLNRLARDWVPKEPANE